MTIALEPNTRTTSVAATRVVWLAIGVAALIAGWFLANQVTLVTPGPYSESNVERAIPEPFPGMNGAQLLSAGAGEDLAYRITYAVQEEPATVWALLHAARGWTASAASTPELVELLYRDEAGGIDHIARFWIAPDGLGGSTITAEFSLLPLRLAPTRGS